MKKMLDMDTTNIINEINARLESRVEKNGSLDGAVMLVNPYHACAANNDRLWAADAVRINNNNIAEVGKVYYDFSDVNNYDSIEDASDLPWDDDYAYFEAEDGEYDLTDDNDADYVLGRIS